MSASGTALVPMVTCCRPTSTADLYRNEERTSEGRIIFRRAYTGKREKEENWRLIGF